MKNFNAILPRRIREIVKLLLAGLLALEDVNCSLIEKGKCYALPRRIFQESGAVQGHLLSRQPDRRHQQLGQGPP